MKTILLGIFVFSISIFPIYFFRKIFKNDRIYKKEDESASRMNQDLINIVHQKSISEQAEYDREKLNKN